MDILFNHKNNGFNANGRIPKYTHLNLLSLYKIKLPQCGNTQENLLVIIRNPNCAGRLCDSSGDQSLLLVKLPIGIFSRIWIFNVHIQMALYHLPIFAKGHTFFKWVYLPNMPNKKKHKYMARALVTSMVFFKNDTKLDLFLAANLMTDWSTE